MIDIEEKVYDIIVDKLAVPREALKKKSDLAKDLGADSLDMVELIMEFEKVFKMSIPDDEVEKIRTVGQIIDYINSRSAGAEDPTAKCCSDCVECGRYNSDE
jgi:acyl carrier protein